MSDNGRRRQLITFATFGVLTVALAVLSSPWWWLAVLFWALLLIVPLAEATRLRRKLLLLGDTGADLRA